VFDPTFIKWSKNELFMTEDIMINNRLETELNPKIKSVGIDYSMTSPAICLSFAENFAWENCKIYYLTAKKKYLGCFADNKIVGEWLYKDWESQQERFHALSNWIMVHLKLDPNIKVYLEDYSLGSTGRVFNIAENTGILKYNLYIQGNKTILMPPSIVKKYATGKGNANKELMYEVFYDETKIDLEKILNCSISNPLTDIVDAYFICKYGKQYEQEQN
jgi:Holliday junction resolvasome RuvABC endonuclease subunit